MDSPSPRRYHHHNLNSPNSSTSSTNSNGGGAGLNLNQQNHLPPPLPTSSPVAAQAPPPPPPLYAQRNNLGRSESGSPYPTTFVQADTNSFKQVVQMLTGCNETARLAAASGNIAARGEAHSSSSSKNHHNIPPMKTIPNKKNQHQHQHQQHQPGFKLYERRNNNLNLNPLLPTLSSSKSSSNINNFNVVVGSPRFSSPRNHHHHHHHEVLSPSILDLPALVLSPVTPLIPDPFGRSSAATPTTPAAAAGYNGSIGGSPILDREAEERAIKEKGFYLHPSPGNTTPRGAEPRLLPLFPTASPRASASSSSA